MPNSERIIKVNIFIKYPELKPLVEFTPKQRIKKIDQYYNKSLAIILALKLFDNYEIIGTKKRPTGIISQIKFDSLAEIYKLEFIENVRIAEIGDDIKIKKEPIETARYFCVKMTVVVEIEGLKLKKQTIEKRFILIKALSFEDAYEKIGLQEDAYEIPYLNSDGRFVRWRIESYDDCFETFADTLADFDNPEGVEIYSKLKSRKAKNPIFWDGKLKF